jgi:hypothetical protein
MRGSSDGEETPETAEVVHSFLFVLKPKTDRGFDFEDEDLGKLLDGTFVTDGPVDLEDYEFVETDDLDNEPALASPVKKQIEDVETLIFGAD